jgi:hypothetical protein
MVTFSKNSGGRLCDLGNCESVSRLSGLRFHHAQISRPQQFTLRLATHLRPPLPIAESCLGTALFKNSAIRPSHFPHPAANDNLKGTDAGRFPRELSRRKPARSAERLGDRLEA